MAETPAKSKAVKAVSPVKKCFVVSEFGIDEKTRIERKQMLKHLVKKVLEPMGYVVQRADEIDDLGQITHQVIERLLDDELVVADLTGLNPNVFYELAVRHAARKPVVTLMTYGQTIPFDIKDVRTVFYDLHDPDKLEVAQDELRQKVAAIEENPADVRNPITVARNVMLLQQSDDPDVRAAGTMLAAINDLREELRELHRPRVVISPQRSVVDLMLEDAKTRVRDLFIPFDEGDKPVALTSSKVASLLDLTEQAAGALLRDCADDPESGIVRLADGRYTRR